MDIRRIAVMLTICVLGILLYLSLPTKGIFDRTVLFGFVWGYLVAVMEREYFRRRERKRQAKEGQLPTRRV
jgi:uncharacterized membrane protein YczE